MVLNESLPQTLAHSIIGWLRCIFSPPACDPATDLSPTKPSAGWTDPVACARPVNEFYSHSHQLYSIVIESLGLARCFDAWDNMAHSGNGWKALHTYFRIYPLRMNKFQLESNGRSRVGKADPRFCWPGCGQFAINVSCLWLL